MTDRTYIQTLIDYNAWANEVCYKAVFELPPEEVTKERPSLLASILVSLNHLLVIDIVWLSHMTGKPHEFKELRAMITEDMNELWQLRQDMDKTLVDYAQSLSARELEEVIDYTMIDGQEGSLSRAMMLSHLALHGNYHRGWIAGLFGQVPQLPTATDLPVYERALRESGMLAMP
jgi:uncharacterized damage-inducible protein DinB